MRNVIWGLGLAALCGACEVDSPSSPSKNNVPMLTPTAGRAEPRQPPEPVPAERARALPVEAPVHRPRIRWNRLGRRRDQR